MVNRGPFPLTLPPVARFGTFARLKFEITNEKHESLDPIVGARRA